jgi:hypothetical protein
MKKVIVAFDRESADFAENNTLQKALRESKKKTNGHWYVKEFLFETDAEASAFTLGLEEGGGWDTPYWVTVNAARKKKLKTT